MELKNSQTKENLMRAFAGEAQARNRYTFASELAKTQKLYALSEVFLFTADQERAHAKVFYDHLQEMSGEIIEITGNYPVEISNNMIDVLKAAQDSEYNESDSVYKEFAQIARDEGFVNIAYSFEEIGKIEKIHGDRYGEFLKWFNEDKVFKEDSQIYWFCTNCGHIHFAEEAPEKCPVCQHDRGYYIRPELVAYTNMKLIK